jgi:uncharacterized protein DUF6265
MRTTVFLPLVFVLSSSAVSLPSSWLRAPLRVRSIQDLAWLEGVWQGQIGDRDFEARYSGAEGGQILSASKYTKDGVPAGFEFERFEEAGDSLVLTPFPEGKSSVTFRLAELDSKRRRVVFENLAHDFPTRISYQRVADNKLTILVSGPGEDGNEQVLTYPLSRR